MTRRFMVFSAKGAVALALIRAKRNAVTYVAGGVQRTPAFAPTIS